MLNIFRPTPPDRVREDQLYEAKRLVLEHRAAAEHHAALADMYERRIARLEPVAASIAASAS